VAGMPSADAEPLHAAHDRHEDDGCQSADVEQDQHIAQHPCEIDGECNGKCKEDIARTLRFELGFGDNGVSFIGFSPFRGWCISRSGHAWSPSPCGIQARFWFSCAVFQEALFHRAMMATTSSSNDCPVVSSVQSGQLIQRASPLKPFCQLRTLFEDRSSNRFSLQLLLLAALNQYLQRRREIEQQSLGVFLNPLPVVDRFNGAASQRKHNFFQTQGVGKRIFAPVRESELPR